MAHPHLLALCLALLASDDDGDEATLVGQRHRHRDPSRSARQQAAPPPGIVPIGSQPHLSRQASPSQIYASNEVEQGTVEAFVFHPRHRRLSRLGHPVATRGSTPAAISVHHSGHWLLFANYNGGNYGIVGVDWRRHHDRDEQGRLFAQLHQIIQVPMTAPNASNNPRQEASHPHQIITDSSGKFVFVCDLGADRIHTLELDVETGKLRSRDGVAVEPGSGPRHMIFSQDERFAYVINELANSVSQFSYDRREGRLSFVRSWPTLDQSVANKTGYTAAEVALSPDGKFLYASNRGPNHGEDEDSIAVFRVDGEEGSLTMVGLDGVGGSGPRHFAMDRSGELVVVGLTNSNKLNLFCRNEGSGRLSPVFSLDVQAPSFSLFL